MIPLETVPGYIDLIFNLDVELWEQYGSDSCLLIGFQWIEQELGSSKADHRAKLIEVSQYQNGAVRGVNYGDNYVDALAAKWLEDEKKSATSALDSKTSYVSLLEFEPPKGP